MVDFRKGNAFASAKGLAAVDYCLILLEDISNYSMLDIVQEHNTAFNGSLPDHSILV